jgi:hypothetical protein
VNYNKVIEECLKRVTSLQKVRIKADPKYVAAESDLSKCPSYEGYVLEEGLSKVKVLILPPDLSITELPPELLEYIADEDKTEVFSDLLVFIIQEMGLEEGDPLVQQLLNCQCIDDVEAFLKDHGACDEDFTEIYKKFILS